MTRGESNQQRGKSHLRAALRSTIEWIELFAPSACSKPCTPHPSVEDTWSGLSSGAIPSLLPVPEYYTALGCTINLVHTEATRYRSSSHWQQPTRNGPFRDRQ